MTAVYDSLAYVSERAGEAVSAPFRAVTRWATRRYFARVSGGR